MSAHTPAPSRARHFLPLAAALSLAAPLSAYADTDASTRLDTVVVSATRTPQSPAYTPSSVTSLSIVDLQTAQVSDLRTALAEVPGVIVVNTGASGGQSSILFRGANSDQTLFIVDGVRINTSTASYANFLGNAGIAGLDRIEALRGPQSTLYGSSAMGGVILLETAHGSSKSSSRASLTAGSFRTLDASLAGSGGDATTGYSISLDRHQTANDRAYNRGRSFSYSTRLETLATPSVLVGATVRGIDSHYEEPGSITYYSAGSTHSRGNLATAYVEARRQSDLRSRLTLGWYQDDYTFDDGTTYDYYRYRNTREILDWQNTWSANSNTEVVGGVNWENSHYWSGAMSKDRSLAEYLSLIVRPIAAVEVTGGLRHDDFDTAGDSTTWRSGLAYRPARDTKLRATYGTGFNAPTPSYRYGSAPYILANPDIRPEKSRGWDIGIDQTLFSGCATVSATYFQNNFEDLLQYEVTNWLTYAGQMVNVSRARTRGIEFEARIKVASGLTTRLGYTYLDASNRVSGARLIRRPRHTFDGDVEYRSRTAWALGAGAHLVADRVDGSYSPVGLSGYTTCRVYASYALPHDMTLKLRLENALDRAYQEVAGFPALPRAAYFSIEGKF